jgi:putative ABC transport system permease protein
MILVVVGIGVGLAGAALVTRALAKLLFGVTPLDSATFLAVAAILLTTAFAASYLPALRATNVRPGTVLGRE